LSAEPAVARPVRAPRIKRAVTARTTAGESTAARLAKIGLVDDLACVLHLPLRYEDETRLDSLAAARDGDMVQLEVVVRDHTIQFRPRRQLVVHVEAADETGAPGLTLRFIHFYGSQAKHFAAGTRLRVRGELRGGGFGNVFGREMIHPRYAAVEAGAPLPDRLTPVYPSAVGLGQGVVRKAIARALDRVTLDETVPAASLPRGLPTIADAIRLVHNPTPDPAASALLAERTHPAWQRIKFDELLAQQLSLAKAYAARRPSSIPARSSHVSSNACRSH
jgi:ATP-dependent DNA helicase RecG